MIVGDHGWKKAATIAAFLAPSLVPLALFTLGPMAASLGISFLSWDLLTSPELVGVDNYAELLRDDEFWAAVGHTFYFLGLYLPLVFAGGLGIALALNRGVRGIAVFRSLYFLPVVTSWVVVALMWKWLLDPSGGLVNSALGLVGIDGPGWWTEPAWAMPAVVLATAWKDLGFVMVIFLAGLQAIPQDYYEAAQLDGAGWWPQFRHITLPLLSPASFFVLTISLINGFQVFDQVFVMTGGGPAGATTVIVERIYTNAFRYSEMGYAAAMSWVLFAIVIAVTIFQFRAQDRWVHYA
jgi:multiple sugar transport system permease protein